MGRKNISPSYLPSFLLPCPHCGHRMDIVTVVQARLEVGPEAYDLEDVTHGCVRCGATLSRMVRPLGGHAREFADEIARRV
jgi:DNA-directed RNA polymerase subunit RPC12/RpoP